MTYPKIKICDKIFQLSREIETGGGEGTQICVGWGLELGPCEGVYSLEDVSS